MSMTKKEAMIFANDHGDGRDERTGGGGDRDTTDDI
jgi:hypothetical protein